MDYDTLYEKSRGVLGNLELYLLISLYIYLIVIVNIEIIRRFILDSSSVWGQESAQFMYIYLTWIGVSWGVHKRVHVRIDVLHTFLSERAKGVLYVLSGVGLLVFSLYAIRWTLPIIETSLEFGSETPGMRVNQAYFQAAIPIAATLTVVRTLQWLYRDLRDLSSGDPVDEGTQLFRADDDEQADRTI